MRPDPTRLSRVVPAVAVVLMLLAAGACGNTPDSAPAGPPPDPARMNPGPTTDMVGEESLDVRLEDITGERPEDAGESRNPFRFGRATPATAPTPFSLEPPESDEPSAQPVPGARPAQGATPGVAPLKFIGLVDAPRSAGLVAVLTDGDFVFYGREDEVIDGRYRIVDIGVESIEIEYLQGGGRLVIQLTGL